jgi:hypothetical protein
MRCSRVQKLLSPFADGEVSQRVAQQVRDHVSHCGSCRETLRHFEQLNRMSRTVLQHEPSEAYWANFLPRLHQQMERAPSESFWARAWESLRRALFPTNPWLRTAGAVSSVILVCAIGWFLTRDTGRQDLLVTPLEYNMEKKTGQGERSEKTPQASQRSEEAEKDETPTLPSAVGGETHIEIQSVEDKEDMAQSPKEEGAADRDAVSGAKGRRASKIEKSLKVNEPSVEFYSTVTADETRWMYELANQQQTMGENEAAAGHYRYILANYPKSQVADDAQFQLNVMNGSLTKEQTLENWQHQRDIWQQFLQTYPQSEFTDQACLKLAESWYHIAGLTLKREDIQQALTVNGQCQQSRQDEAVLRTQSIELQEMLHKEKD